MAAKKSVARETRGQESRLQDDPALEEILPLIQRAKDGGITFDELQERVQAPSKPLKARLAALIKEGAIHGPIRYGSPRKQEYYFAAGRGPSIESVSEKLARLVQKAAHSTPATAKSLQGEVTGIENFFFKDALQRALDTQVIRGPYGKGKFYLPAGSGPTVESVCARVVALSKERGSAPPSAKWLQSQLKGVDAAFLPEAIKKAVESRAVLELKCDKLMFYVHRDVAVGHFGAFAAADAPSDRELTLEDIIPAYRRLKAEQRGLSTVYISSLLEALKVSKESLHTLLRKESKAGRVSIHPSTVAEPPDVLAAGIKVSGFAGLHVTVVIRDAS